MDQIRRIIHSSEIRDNGSSSLLRESPNSSAFSKPILSSSASLIPSPKLQFGSPVLNGSINFGSSPNHNAITSTSTSTSTDAKYRECLRNYAASIGGHVTDGCGEFMPAGPMDPLKCAACGCHRSFHWKEPEPEPDATKNLAPLSPARRFIKGKSFTEYNESSSGERIEFYSSTKTFKPNAKECKMKRFRTKFSGEQKEKMKSYAEGVGWRVQKKDEGEMERFCSEIGINRQVFKVWMHNNKHLVKNNNNYKEDEHIEERESKFERVKLRPRQNQEINGDRCSVER